MSLTVTLRIADATSKHIVEHFFLNFFVELSQYDPKMEINAHGLPVYGGFDGAEEVKTPEECVRFNWWIRDRGEWIIIEVAGKPAGFAIVFDRQAPLPDGVDLELMDFYIAPKYRRKGVGQAAAKQIFDRRRGRWILYELAANIPALRFWHGFLEDYTGGNFENLEDGAQQRFDNRYVEEI